MILRKEASGRTLDEALDGLATAQEYAKPEITPEMIEAGLDELWNHDITEPTEDEMREVVAAVFQAMRKAND